MAQRRAVNEWEDPALYEQDPEQPQQPFGGEEILGSDPNQPAQKPLEFTQPQATPAPQPETPAPQAPDTSAWNTDGYGTPGYTAGQFGGPMAGWNADKWNDPNHQTPKYVVGRILSNYNLQDPNQRAAAIADIQRAYPGTTFNGKDIISIPGVSNSVDIFGGASSGQYSPKWIDNQNDPSGPAAPVPAPGQMPVAAGGVPGGGVPGGGAPGGGASFSDERLTNPAIMEAYRNALLGMLGPDALDPEALYDSPEMRSVRLAGQRAEERERAQLAERAAAQGTSMSGGFESELRGIRQDRGEREEQFMGQLATQYMERQAEELRFGISQAQAAGQFDIATAMQQQLALLDAAIRREGIAQQASAESGRLGLGYSQLAQDAQTEAGRLGFNYAQLDQSGRLEGNRLGFNYAELQQRANENAVRYMYGV